MSLTGDYLSAQDALRAGLVTEVVPHDQLLPAARKVRTASSATTRAPCVRLLSSYHRIDESVTSEGLWPGSHGGQAVPDLRDDIAANREAVLKRGRAQVP